MNRLLKYCGTAGALAALLAIHSAHWAALQAVAWSRMLLEFSQEVPIATAVVRTFDGQHPCPLCLKVSDGAAAAQTTNTKQEALQKARPLEALWELRVALIPVAPLGGVEGLPAAPSLHPDFLESPPSPPPRLHRG